MSKVYEDTIEGRAVIWSHATATRRALQQQVIAELSVPPSSRVWPGSAFPLFSSLMVVSGIVYGIPYIYGDEGAQDMDPIDSIVGVGGKGQSLDGFDCSGLIRWIARFLLRHNVIKPMRPPMRRRAIEIASQYPKYPISEAIPGDVWVYGSPVQHVMLQVTRKNLIGACGGTSSTFGQVSHAMVKLKPLDYWKSARQNYVVRPFEPVISREQHGLLGPVQVSAPKLKVGANTLQKSLMGGKLGAKGGTAGIAVGVTLGALAGFAQDNDIGLKDIAAFFQRSKQ